MIDIIEPTIAQAQAYLLSLLWLSPPTTLSIVICKNNTILLYYTDAGFLILSIQNWHNIYNTLAAYFRWRKSKRLTTCTILVEPTEFPLPTWGYFSIHTRQSRPSGNKIFQIRPKLFISSQYTQRKKGSKNKLI